MPFLEYDPREHKAYEGVKVPKEVIVPTTDSAAWLLNQDYCHIYNKLDLALAQDLECGPIGVEPDKFPVFMKPIVNLWGGGHSSRKITDAQQLEENGQPGMFWMPLLTGRHISHDFVMEDGEVVFHIGMEGKPIGNGMFDYWSVVPVDSRLIGQLSKWLKSSLTDYTGMVNLETIGDKIIEAHLRWGDIWYSGDTQLIKAVVDLYAGNGWHYDSEVESFFVFPVWGKPTANYKWPQTVKNGFTNEALIFDWEEKDEGPTPVGGRRIANFSTSDLRTGLRLRREILDAVKPKIPEKFWEKLS